MLFNLRTAADWRALFYVLLPVVGTLLVGHGVIAEDKLQLWLGLGSAVLGPVVAAVMARSVSSGRTAFYALLAALQLLVVGYGIATDASFTEWMALIVALLGGVPGGVAAANTDTSPAAG